MVISANTLVKEDALRYTPTNYSKSKVNGKHYKVNQKSAAQVDLNRFLFS